MGSYRRKEVEKYRKRRRHLKKDNLHLNGAANILKSMLFKKQKGLTKKPSRLQEKPSEFVRRLSKNSHR